MKGNGGQTIAGAMRRWHLHHHVFTSLLAIAIGILGGYGALLFRLAIRAAQYGFYRHGEDILTFVDSLPFYVRLGMPIVGGLLVGPIVYWGAREAKGHGVPEVMEAVALRAGVIRPRVALVKILASGICIGSGGSVGREGPIVQIGSSVGSTIGQVLKVPRFWQRTMVGCGAAAGIAATFNAPIAGVLFAVEVLLGDFGLATFSPVVLSSVTATTISRHYLGDFPAFVIPSYKVVSLWEFAIYPVLGVVAGIAALMFIVVLYRTEDLFEALPVPEYLKPALGGLLLGLILLQWPHVFGVGYGTINLALTGHLAWQLLGALVLVKIIATSITIGSGGSGGIFAPSLFIGAMCGGLFGWLVNWLFPAVTAGPGAYSLVAMGGVVAGTTHAPITAILIIFELTGEYRIILPLMLCCIVSTIVTTSLKRGSIYTIKLLRRGIDVERGLEQETLRGLKVREIMDANVTCIPEAMPLEDVIATLKQRDVSYLHVVDNSGSLAGIISFRDIRPVLEEESLKGLVIARDVASTEVVSIGPDDNLLKALQLMVSRGISQLPVVVDADGVRRIVGAVRRKDILEAYERAVVQGRSLS